MQEGLSPRGCDSTEFRVSGLGFGFIQGSVTFRTAFPKGGVNC